MDGQELMAALLEVAERAGLEVRQAALSGEGGGVCTVRGRRILFVDVLADTGEQLARTAAALAELPELDGLYVVPQVRQLLDQNRGG